MGQLTEHPRGIWPGPGHEDHFVFSVKTSKGVCRDDRDINSLFPAQAARALGIYWTGFGFHAFRREAITAMSALAGVGQAMNAAGHANSDMNQDYTLVDLSAKYLDKPVHKAHAAIAEFSGGSRKRQLPLRVPIFCPANSLTQL
jgi:integrase